MFGIFSLIVDGFLGRKVILFQGMTVNDDEEREHNDTNVFFVFCFVCFKI